jgi:hypothetical protein
LSALFTEGIDGGTEAEGSVLIEVAELVGIARSITGDIVEFSKEIAPLAKLLVGLNGSKEMRVLVIERATTAIEKR